MRRQGYVSVLLGIASVLSLIGGATSVQSAENKQPGIEKSAGRAVDDDAMRIALRIPVSAPLNAGFGDSSFPSNFSGPRKSSGCRAWTVAFRAAAIAPPRQSSGCKYRGGTWILSATGVRARGQAQLRLAPVVSVAEAWSAGAFGWSRQKRRAYVSTFPSNGSISSTPVSTRASANCNIASRGHGLGCAYAIVDSPSPTRRGSLLSEFMSSPTTTQCSDVNLIVSTLDAWGLTVTPLMRSSLLNRLAQCPPKRLRYLRIDTPSRTPANPFTFEGKSSTLQSFEQLLSTPPGAPIPQSLFGIQVAPDASSPEVPIGRLRLWDSDVGWNAVEPERGQFRWERLDQLVRNAASRGIAVDYVLGPTPPWAGERSTDPPRNVKDLTDFVKVLVGRYKGQLNSVQVWNEPNLRTYFTGSPNELAAITRSVFATIKSLDSTVKVIAPSTTVRANGSLFGFYTRYLKSLGKLGWPIDAFSVHSYPDSVGGPSERSASLQLFRQILNFAEAPDLPLLDTEINYGLGGSNSQKRDIRDQDAADYIAQTFLESIRLGITATDWYLWTKSNYDLLGIQLNPTSESSIRSWRWTHNLVVGAQFIGCLSSSVSWLCSFTRGSRTFGILYSSTPEGSDVEIPAQWDEVCPESGACIRQESRKLRSGMTPILLQSSGSQIQYVS